MSKIKERDENNPDFRDGENFWRESRLRIAMKKKHERGNDVPWNSFLRFLSQFRIKFSLVKFTRKREFFEKLSRDHPKEKMFCHVMMNSPKIEKKIGKIPKWRKQSKNATNDANPTSYGLQKHYHERCYVSLNFFFLYSENSLFGFFCSLFFFQ